jgi:hypothetical protein
VTEVSPSFIDALRALVADMTPRAQEIVFARYGISGKKKMTLEEIGGKYGITRERVRQVIREVFKKVKEKKANDAFSQAHARIAFTLEKNSGIMEESDLLDLLGSGSPEQRGAARFFLECMDDIADSVIKDELLASYSLPGFDQGHWQAVKNAALEVLQKAGQPLDEKNYFEKVSKNSGGTNIEKKTLFDYLAVAEEIKKNNFGKWGIAKWKEVTPKGTREKAYLVMKEGGKPLHFKTIAQLIDKHNLNKKKTHAQTVHNELIKDKKFVLVGRGMYALAEWGYKKGTVKDVIEEILQKSAAPLSKDEVLAQVLKLRQVKKSTIIINLNNFFGKNEQGMYIAKR